MSSGTSCPYCGSALRQSTHMEEVFAPLEEVRQDIPRELSTIYSNKSRCRITGWTWLQRRGGLRIMDSDNSDVMLFGAAPPLRM